MNINYEYYRAFYYTVTCKSFTRAAEHLGTSQPNVSRSIKKLEELLGCCLLIRSRRQIHLTEEGDTLYRHVSAAFSHLLAGEEELAQGRGLNGGVLRIAVTEIALRTFLLPVLKEFRAQYPGVHLKLLNGTTPSSAASLCKGLADLAVVTATARVSPGLTEIPLSLVPEVAICGSAYAHLSREPLTLSQLTQYPIVSLGETTQTLSLYTQFFAKHGLSFEPDIQAASADLILPLVKANLGIGFVPELFLQEESPGISVFPLTLTEPIPPREVRLLLPQDRPLGPAAQAMKEILLQHQSHFPHEARKQQAVP